ncbi:putative adhesin [Streptomyces alfalfae]|uniref:putative adhesin n=1 Tax=Streptomyces alfalfae TaxID=1642299 RepID=UPI00359C4B2D
MTAPSCEQRSSEPFELARCPTSASGPTVGPPTPGRGSPRSRRAKKGASARRPFQAFEPGDELPNHMSKTPDKLAIHEGSTTVERTTPLSELLKPNMGDCHWAACTLIKR